MEVKRTLSIAVHLSEEEAIAIVKFIGNTSHSQRMQQQALRENESQIVSNLYSVIQGALESEYDG